MSILIVDDDRATRNLFRMILTSNGYPVIEADNGLEAVRLFEKETPDAVLLDLMMPGMDGLETMQEIRKMDPATPVIIVTAYGDIPTSVEAIKKGAYDFIVKPVNADILLVTMERALEKLELEQSLKRLNAGLETSLEASFGKSRAIKTVIAQIHQIAMSGFSVIIQGETGVGKTFAARAIHSLSRRADNPFVRVDMGLIPEALAESELFGYERGAFTGADKRRAGFFERADKGTIFIDEIQNMPPELQKKLLSVVEEKKIYPLGNVGPVEIDLRIISATNSDLRKSLAEKTFREDLFFRLGEFMITIPPLRERTEDIQFFAWMFILEAGAELNKQIKEITDEALSLLLRYPWPGNIRELKNVIRRAVLSSDNGLIRPEHIEFLIGHVNEDEQALPSLIMSLKELSAIAVSDVETKAVRQALQIAGGNKTKAASMLQIDYKTLLTKIKTYNIQTL